MSRIEIEGTDLEVVCYVNAGGNLIIRVNKAGICVQDVTLANATRSHTGEALMAIGALTRPVIRDLDKAPLNDLLREYVEPVTGTVLPSYGS